MRPHDRYQACKRFQPMDRLPLQEWAPWEATITRWEREAGQDRTSLLRWLGECDQECNVGVDFSMKPPFQERILAEDETTVTKLDGMGLTYRQFKGNPDRSMPEFIGSPVKTPQDWQEIKRRFAPSSPGRYPSDWAERVGRWTTEGPVLRFYGLVANYYGGPSLFGFVRMLLGAEQALYAFYDAPLLIEDMMETATEFSIAMLKKALCEAPITVVQFWEDMCYKGGPLISPAIFRKFMLPRYKRITDVIRGAGVDIIFVDSDGNVEQLLPLWLEGGINGVLPMEQAAGNDVHAYRRKYGRNLLMTGGIDKRALAKDTHAIDRELESKIPLAFKGGYVPTLDHSIPPDVSYENFAYYWERKKRLLGV